MFVDLDAYSCYARATGRKMLVTLESSANTELVQAALRGLGLWTTRLESHKNSGRKNKTVALVVAPHSASVPAEQIEQIEGVADVQLPASPHPLLDQHRELSVAIDGVELGAPAPPVLIAGPCSVESPEQIASAAQAARAAGARLLRGGVYKPRTSPHGFSGHGRDALGWMRSAADDAGLGMVTEVMSEREVDAVAAAADMIQIGSRSMQSFGLLKAVGRCAKPVLLKRGMAATVREWLLAGEHLLAAGAAGVVFCERGIQSFDPQTRNLLDLGAVALLSKVYGLPVVVDPSHAAGRRDLVDALSRAALSAGAHGLIIECHHDPGTALCDGPQALSPAELQTLGEHCFGNR